MVRCLFCTWAFVTSCGVSMYNYNVNGRSTEHLIISLIFGEEGKGGGGVISHHHNRGLVHSAYNCYWVFHYVLGVCANIDIIMTFNVFFPNM